MKKIIYSVILLIVCLQIDVYAANEASLTVNCRDENLVLGGTTTCTLSASISQSVEITGMSLDLSSDSDLTLSFTSLSPVVGTLNNNRIVLSITDGTTGNLTLGTLNVKVSDTASFGDKALNFRNIQFTNTGNVYETSNVSKTIKVLSNVNTLESITVDGVLLPSFSSNKTSYEITSTASKVKIAATASDSTSTITGLGEKTVDYGKNTYEIKVTSQSGTSRTYTLTITKEDNRSTDNTLKSLSVEGVNFTFDRNKTTYNLNVASTVESVKITSTLNNTSASYVKDYGNREVDLEYGLNKIEVRVNSEKGEVMTYTLNITREDNRSDEGDLSSLTINDVPISLTSNTLEYEITLRHKHTKTSVVAKATDGAKIEYEDIDLKVGDNQLKIKVTSEKGTEKEYTITIKRLTLEESKVVLENIVIKDYNLNFSKDVTTYTLEISSDTNELEISVTPDEEEISLSVLGNRDLVNGSVITLNIKDDEQEYTYTINIVKEIEESLILGFLTMEQLCYIIFSIGLLAFIASIIYAIRTKKIVKK